MEEGRFRRFRRVRFWLQLSASAFQSAQRVVPYKRRLTWNVETRTSANFPLSSTIPTSKYIICPRFLICRCKNGAVIPNPPFADPHTT